MGPRVDQQVAGPEERVFAFGGLGVGGPLDPRFGIEIQPRVAGEQDCPVLESWWDNTFSFPWWCGMDDETIEYLTSSLKAAVAELIGE